MNKPDHEAFDKEVKLIRQRYGGQSDWKDPASVYAYLYWRSRELDQEDDNPVPKLSLVRLIGLSQVDRYIWDAVNLIAQAHLTNGDLLPDPLAQWIVEVLRDQYLDPQEKFRRRPATGSRLRVKYWMMWQAVENLVARGYPETRRGGEAQANAAEGTACDVVGVAFFVSYKHVEGIWYARDGRPSSSEEPE